MVAAVENTEGTLEKADREEERLVEEMRIFGRTAMQGWADERVSAKTEREVRLQPGVHRQGEKNSSGTQSSAKSRSLSRSIGPGTSKCGHSFRVRRSALAVVRGLMQRAITDFAADQPFAVAQMKLREHYGFEIGESTIQRITLSHARTIYESSQANLDYPRETGLSKQIVAEIDGGIIPVVEPDANQKDKRKGKTLLWKEAKISLAHAKGSRTPIYGGAITGGVEAAGQQLFACAVRAGFGTDSHVHAVGDGAPWIVGQIEEQFGNQGSYLIDFYHVCEYLSGAAKVIAPEPVARDAWMETQKDAMKTGRVDDVLQALVPHCEPLELSDAEAPVRACHRYLSGRKDQLNYREALAEGLPIGSGEIESAHRYVAQKRLKAPRSLVARRACRAHARLAYQPPERRLVELLGSPRRQPADIRKLYRGPRGMSHGNAECT